MARNFSNSPSFKELEQSGWQAKAEGYDKFVGKVSRPAARRPRRTLKAEIAKIKLINKDIDHPDRIVFTDIFIEPFGK